MIAIPDGFDVGSLISDFFALSQPFVVIAFVFTVFAVIKKISRSVL